ncbi:ATP-binding protein [Herbaspirillum sp. RTI4]|uniref:ATP-binding protein n=1 Tax=Herbaspirillum sp. RTI4 TaxID=3048640 RepID=UPI002AB376CC|nr:ATP-binding protein [Herbaspirillum sp. RTI4]MDY7579826.1 ATP-binding protein [Herbaspirillum sp. RTI4]MEA9981913.1 ATP-binding protein [Herbaspirillum sp. RTI4]
MRHFFGSIANRVFLILLAGILVATLVTIWLANNERKGVLRDIRVQHAAERVEQIVLALDNQTPQVRQAILQAARNFGFDVEMVAADDQLRNDDSDALIDILKGRFGTQRPVIGQRETSCNRNNGIDASGHRRPETCRLVYVGLDDGKLLKIKLHIPSDLPPPFAQNGGLPLPYPGPYTILFLVLIAALAYAVARMAASPIQRLSTAATALGRDIDQPPLEETGPTEIKLAARAFNAMQARIRRQIQHRTHMLAAITHDLQTPLTRLRLRLEKVGDEELRIKLIDDLAVMQGMVREGLDLARSMDDSSEKMQRLDIDSLLASVCADASDAGHQVELQGSTRQQIIGQPSALRRCLTNLLDNAIKYGQRAEVSCIEENGRIVITLHDAGPGIPEDQLDAAFDAFYRVETSRSRDTGGTGLGLTIARNIAENNLATLTLKNHSAGGLVATLSLPIAPLKN